MKPFSLRTRLTLSFTAILATLLAALGVVYYRALALQLDSGATPVSASHERDAGYLRFDQDVPTLVYDRNDPDEAAFITQATRYYQIYDNVSGQLLVASPAMDLLGLHYTPRKCARSTRGRMFRIWKPTMAASGCRRPCSVRRRKRRMPQVESRSKQDAALRRFLWVFLLSIPAGLIIAVIAGRWMAARALTLVASGVGQPFDRCHRSHPRLPVRGTGDELDNVAEAFNGTLGRLKTRW
jgi:hypothetical protein